MKNKFFKRADTLMWLVGMQVVAFGLDAALSNVGVLNLTPEVTTFIGLVLSQITKSLREVVAVKQKELDDSSFED